MSPEHSNYVYRETEASESFAQDYPPSQPKLELNHSTISTSIGSSPAMVKKLHHNARKRDRRKKINTLYSSLRTLLPPADQAVLLVNICFHLNFFWKTRMFKALGTLQFLLLTWEFFYRKLVEERIALRLLAATRKRNFYCWPVCTLWVKN